MSPLDPANQSAPRRAPVVGVLVDWLESEYQRAILAGVSDAARDANVNLACFTGGVLDSPLRFGRQRNIVYELARSEGIDGLVILAGTLGNHRGLEHLSDFCERFRPLPMVSIAATLPGMTGILIDGEHAFREAIGHLVEHHHYRRIAYVGGPSGNLDARTRLHVFGETLARYSLVPPEAFIVSGDFQYESGVEAIRVLVDEREQMFDAVVVANDQMALGVIDGLRARGKRVPRDVAVTGFDDIAEAAYVSPPLTTIRQPLGAQGRLALEMLLKRLHGEPVEDVVNVPTELVVRRSCGCYSDVRRTNTTSHLPPPLTRPGVEPGVDDALRQRRERILEAVRTPVAGVVHDIGPGWEEALLDTLVAELRGGPEGAFADWVNALVELSLRGGGTGNAWQPALSALRRELLPCLAADPTLRTRAEDLLQEARVLVADAVEHSQAQRRLDIERRTRTLADAAETISGALDMDALRDALVETLPRVGVPSAAMVLFDREAVEPHADEPLDPLSVARRLVFHSDVSEPPDEQTNVTTGLEVVAGVFLPPAALPPNRQFSLAVEPLFVKDEPLGYVTFELGPLDGVVYETVREQISGVVKAARLIEALVATGAERARLLDDLQVRAAELQEAYQALQDNQQRLLSAEKMASLGRITANIAHEMNTPLAAVRTALAEIDKRVTEYQASAGDSEVTPQDHAEIAAEMRDAVQLARSAAERAAGFVRGIKTQTRDIAGHEKVPFDPAPVIEEALLLLSYDFRKSGHEVVFRPPARPLTLVGAPGLLAQVVTNLVTNALDAMPEGGGAITLSLERAAGAARLVVEDTGSGIPDELKDKIFEPMFTTKPLGRGTGLGLSIVRDLVTGQLGGTIDLTSQLGVGTTFVLTFPVAEAA